MSIIYVLIPIAILLTILGIYFFFWAVKTEQFQDLEKQGLSILFDDDNLNGNKNDKNTVISNNTNTETPIEKTKTNTNATTLNKDNE